ncbi:hypothetical protein [Actinoplanes sp. GCM10030250]|uniref:hypothetical protein n=1 Tax=Actinoplanes sp. GCM10030250 TaxID=3273376 RepID=UPI0036224896
MTAVSAPRRHRTATGGLLLAAAQFAGLAWFVFCLTLAVDRAAEFSSLPFLIDEDADMLSGWAWALPVGWTLSMGPLVAGLSVVATAILLITRYAHGNRLLLAALIAGGLAAACTVAVGVGPDVQSVLGWLND